MNTGDILLYKRYFQMGKFSWDTVNGGINSFSLNLECENGNSLQLLQCSSNSENYQKFVCVCVGVCAYVSVLTKYFDYSQGLHNTMTVDELDYYFGVFDPIDVPKYEVVTLSNPADQPECEFYAFGRLVIPKVGGG